MCVLQSDAEVILVFRFFTVRNVKADKYQYSATITGYPDYQSGGVSLSQQALRFDNVCECGEIRCNFSPKGPEYDCEFASNSRKYSEIYTTMCRKRWKTILQTTVLAYSTVYLNTNTSCGVASQRYHAGQNNAFTL